MAAEVGEPVVVRAALRDGDVEVLHARDPEQRRRVEHGLADAFGVEVGDARCGLERARSELGVLAFAGGDLRLLLRAHSPGACQREVVRGITAAVPDDPLVAVIVGLDVPDAVAVLLGRVLEHLVGVFEHVTVGVDELQIDSRISDGHVVLPTLPVHGTARGRHRVAWALPRRFSRRSIHGHAGRVPREGPRSAREASAADRRAEGPSEPGRRRGSRSVRQGDRRPPQAPGGDAEQSRPGRRRQRRCVEERGQADGGGRRRDRRRVLDARRRDRHQRAVSRFRGQGGTQGLPRRVEEAAGSAREARYRLNHHQVLRQT